MITAKQYKNACYIAQPCDCAAPIAYTGTDEGVIKTRLYSIDIKAGKVKILYDEIEKDTDLDDLNLVCTHCGKSWVEFNPLFF